MLHVRLALANPLAANPLGDSLDAFFTDGRPHQFIHRFERIVERGKLGSQVSHSFQQRRGEVFINRQSQCQGLREKKPCGPSSGSRKAAPTSRSPLPFAVRGSPPRGDHLVAFNRQL